MMLAEGDSHGYDLYDQLDQFGFDQDCLDSSIVYRHLRDMEELELIRSRWDEKSKGPRKRVYQILEKGLNELDNWMSVLGRQQDRIEYLSKRFNSLEIKDKK
jgi:DNA-binding PadR family transcriptional regulator